MDIDEARDVLAATTEGAKAALPDHTVCARTITHSEGGFLVTVFVKRRRPKAIVEQAPPSDAPHF